MVPPPHPIAGCGPQVGSRCGVWAEWLQSETPPFAWPLLSGVSKWKLGHKEPGGA